MNPCSLKTKQMKLWTLKTLKYKFQNGTPTYGETLD
jgi:hypothetical protein